MLSLEKRIDQNRVVVMSDIAIILASVKSTFNELAKQTEGLGMGLLNAAPNKSKPNKSVQYLLDISQCLTTLATQCDELLHKVEDNSQQSSPGLKN